MLFKLRHEAAEFIPNFSLVPYEFSFKLTGSYVAVVSFKKLDDQIDDEGLGKP